MKEERLLRLHGDKCLKTWGLKVFEGFRLESEEVWKEFIEYGGAHYKEVV